MTRPPELWKRNVVLVAAAVVAVTASLACTESTASGPPALTPSNQNDGEDATADLMEHHRYHHHGGVTLFIAMSLDTLGLPADRRVAVEKLRAELHVRMEKAHAAEHDLVATLADGLEAGAFDAAKVDTDLAEVATRAADLHDATADVMNELHAALAPPERAALVDKVDAHWTVFREANAEEARAKREDSRLAMLQSELGLTDEQTDKIGAALQEGMKTIGQLDTDEVDKYLRTFGEGFRSDHFDDKSLTTESTVNTHLVGWGVTRMARFVEIMGPMLTQEQRGKLARRLRAHASHNPSAEGRP